MKKQRVKAFTILEMSIAMLIASLVIGITYTVYTIVARSYSSFNAKNNDMAMIVRLDELLKKDFARADLIYKDQQSGFALKLNGKFVYYEINPDNIVRVAVATDTFKVAAQGLITSFEGTPFTEVSATEEKNRIDEVQISFLFKNENISYYYHKQYSSANLILRNPNALH